MYWNYFKYIIEHKLNVFIECLKMGQIWHGITHDLSKFLPSEFFPYAEKIFGGDYTYKFFEVEDNFNEAWLLHQRRNKHHWNYWVSVMNKGKLTPNPMPEKYVKQMIADWRGMSRKLGDTARAYYLKNKNTMVLNYQTIKLIEYYLDIK